MLIWTAMLNRPSFGNLRERWKLWVGQPAPWIWFLDITALLLVAPLILWLDPLDGYRPGSEGLDDLGSRLATLARPFATNRLQLDDFEYVAESRTPAALSRSAFTPHNTHLVPLFRVWTYLWVRAAGSLAELPEAFGVAGYLTYVVTMLLLGHVIAWESGRTAHGFAFMALFGVSALLEPTVRWFAASQALLAGTVVLASLAAWQRWRAGGSWVWLLLGTLATMAAPLVWSGGYVAGPAGLVYLLASGQSRDRRVAWVPLAGSLAVAVAAALVAGSTIAAPANFHDRTLREAINPIQGAISTAQGCVEILALRNLGLEAPTTAGQGVLLSLLGLAAWLAWRGRPWRANPLEAAGATVAILGFALINVARGYFTFDSLRDLSWYQAIPQLGAVLFLAGMLLGRPSGDSRPPRRLTRPTRGAMLVVVGVVFAAFILQQPRVRARLVATAEPLTATERERFPIPRLQRIRARYIDGERANWQRRALASLDRVEAAARASNLGKDDVASSVGRVVVPGMPVSLTQLDGVKMLGLPETSTQPAPRVASRDAAFRTMVAPEAEPRPPWLAPDEVWPPPRKP